MEEQAGGRLVGAFELVWEDVGARHGELPVAVFIVGSGTLGMARDVIRLGHFGHERWEQSGGGALVEIFVAGEGLARGAGPVLGTVLHEGALPGGRARGEGHLARRPVP